jgi:hypothetical protein
MQADSKKANGRRASTNNSNAWEPVKLIKHEATGLASRVFRVSSYPHPRYSFEVGCVDAEGAFKRFQIPVVKIEGGKVEVVATDPDAVRWVIEEAEIFILEAIQKREEELQLQAKSKAPKPRQETRRPSV